MLSVERREAILRLLEEKNAVSVEELCAHFFVSGATIRRDLDKMAREGLVSRTYGGAVLLGRSSEMPLNMREGENIKGKESIARAAAALVTDGSTLFIDPSSTALRLASFLAARKGLTVVTNALKTAQKLGEYGQIQVFCTGGRLRDNNVSLVGDAAGEFLSRCNADLAFFSCRGFSVEQGATDASEEEAEIKRRMLRRAKTRVLLCDTSKIGRVFFSTICPAQEIDLVITDTPLSEETQKKLTLIGVRTIAAGPDHPAGAAGGHGSPSLF